ncbi:MAG TPA: helix-turn-helix domain-containing protein [Candidatus Angelobacter sp.]|nr:helix-turn-helix domain-containing protein [Candidatus Angelobacter sp.]
MNGSPKISRAQTKVGEELLGEPLTIAEVAEILGCSPWTIRQRYLPQGLPHLRATTEGKLVFFRAQIIRWILERQGGHQ